MSNSLHSELIAAVATAPGHGGVGIVRISGQGARAVGEAVCGKKLQPRVARACSFSDNGEVIDQGIAVLFADGASFTGEEIVELQGHGGPVVMQRLLDCVCAHGARIAYPGEFSERAFLNGKIDLAQAEAIADLIAANSNTAARAAMRSLQGDFSKRVNELEAELSSLRVLVEACIDFPEEEVEFLEKSQVQQRTDHLIDRLTLLKRTCTQGALLTQGAAVALIGHPNAGKSSLLNALSGMDTAIVTDIPGTTRDLLNVDLVLDGLAVRLVDTAGLRQTIDPIEQIGVERARSQAQNADLVVLIVDGSDLSLKHDAQGVKSATSALLSGIEHSGKVLVAINKVDLLTGTMPVHDELPYCQISAKTGAGLAELKSAITRALGFNEQEATFTARARHIEAIDCAYRALQTASGAMLDLAGIEIVAEELRVAHLALGEIVGTVTPDDLLGRIFSEFCIGK